MAVVGGGVTCETIVVSDGLVWRESKEEAMTITGGCRCGAVRYSIEEKLSRSATDGVGTVNTSVRARAR